MCDTDHCAVGEGETLWARKSFLRGHHTILMDFGIIDVANPLHPSHGVPSYESLEPARYAMGDTLRFVQQLPLTAMHPNTAADPNPGNGLADSHNGQQGRAA